MTRDVLAGLTSAEVNERRARVGPNTLPAAHDRALWRIMLTQLGQLMIVVLLITAGIAALAGETADLVAILLIVALSAALGAAQEYRAERALEALHRLAAPKARVRRDGAVTTIDSSDVVPEDVLLVDAGESVPADLHLIEAADLRIDEAVLTGESAPVHKVGSPYDGPGRADQADLAYQGTVVTHGRGVGLVIATGSRTKFGEIAELLRDEDSPRTPLQRRLDRVGRTLSIAAIALGAVLVTVGTLRGAPMGMVLLTAISLAVAAIPEALPAVVTMTLAIGARRLARHNALIRRLPAVETLGSVTFICTDKTGTLTENRMRVVAWSDGVSVFHSDDGVGAPSAALLDALAISNDALISHAGEISGDPTEVALCAFSADAGHHKPVLEHSFPRIAELAFSADRARMTTAHRSSDGQVIAFTKGAPERVLPLCALPDDVERRATAVVEEMTGDALRVLAVARRTIPALPPAVGDVEQKMEFLGLVGIVDPPRPGVADAVAACRAAGIHVAMVTGDHVRTALAIARRLGIATVDAQVLTGPILHSFTDAELATRVPDVTVYARVAPDDKIRIVTALQARGELVAMTGDGVNDAPALQRADIGVAMGRCGTDVARQAAAMILLDDDFSTIVHAVAEGRRIYDNIIKFVRYTLAGNVGEIIAVIGAPLVGLPLPLLPLQILWINLVTDGLPAIALTAEPPEPDVMRRRPRPPDAGVLSGGVWQDVLRTGALIGVATLVVQALGVHNGWHWQSMTFTTLTFMQMPQALISRSDHDPMWHGLWSNRALLGAVLLTLALQCALLYVEPLRSLFRTEPLGLAEMFVVCMATAIVTTAGELGKWRRRSRMARTRPARRDDSP